MDGPIKADGMPIIRLQTKGEALLNFGPKCFDKGDITLDVEDRA